MDFIKATASAPKQFTKDDRLQAERDNFAAGCPCPGFRTWKATTQLSTVILSEAKDPRLLFRSNQTVKPGVPCPDVRTWDNNIQTSPPNLQPFAPSNSFSLAITGNASATYTTSAFPRVQPQFGSSEIARRSPMNRQPTTCGSSP